MNTLSPSLRNAFSRRAPVFVGIAIRNTSSHVVVGGGAGGANNNQSIRRTTAAVVSSSTRNSYCRCLGCCRFQSSNSSSNNNNNNNDNNSTRTTDILRETFIAQPSQPIINNPPHQEQQEQEQQQNNTITPSTTPPTKPPKERVPIHKTPRGKAAAKQKPKIETKRDRQRPPQTEQEQQQHQHQQAKSKQSQSSSTHSPTHFVKGGTPDDPTPPPFHLTSYGDDSLYTLVLLRHGESEWNSLNRYTGWCDVDLTDRGRSEARAAGRLLKENGIEVDHTFTSVLKRASFTTNTALEYSGQPWVPVTKSWRLNERHYGALQGYNKDTAYEELGIDQELVMEMRRSYMTRPPVMENDHQFWHGKDRRYKELSQEQLDNSRAESLQDAAARILPFFNSQIVPSIRSGNKCLIVSHANTIRTLIKHIDDISDEDIKGMSIPTGIPLLYRLDRDLRPVDPNIELEFRYMVEPKGYTWATSRMNGFHGVYLGDLERLQDIQMKRDVTNRDWQRIILRNVARQLDEADGSGEGGNGDGVLETRQLYFQIHKKMEVKEFGNMLLLGKMKDQLEYLMWDRKQQYLTMAGFESILDKLHLSSEGSVVEPFVAMTDTDAREKRAQEWYEMLALDLEEECLIK